MGNELPTNVSIRKSPTNVGNKGKKFLTYEAVMLKLI